MARRETGGKVIDICFHLGAHFCANAQFQDYMAQNRKRLAGSGTQYWHPERLHDGLFAGLLNDPIKAANRAQRSVGRIQIALSQLEAAWPARLIFCAPDLLGRPSHMFAAGSLYPGARVRLSRVAAGFGGRPLRVGLSIRSYDAFWTGALASRIASGYSVPRPDRLDELCYQPRRWRHLVADIKQALPEAEVVVWSYDALAGELGQQFAGLTGAAPPSTMLLPQAAGGPVPAAIRLAEILAERGEARDSATNASGLYQPFSDEQLLKLRQDYA